jgi:hypothetical protein
LSPDLFILNSALTSAAAIAATKLSKMGGMGMVGSSPQILLGALLTMSIAGLITRQCPWPALTRCDFSLLATTARSSFNFFSKSGFFLFGM